MIVPMKHATLLCVASAREEALARLAGLGVLHVELRLTDTEAIVAARAAVEETQRAIAAVQTAAGGDWRQLSIKAAGSREGRDRDLLVRGINDLADRYVALREETRALAAEIRRFEPWGDFDPAAAARLTAAGREVTLFKAAPGAPLPDVGDAWLQVLSRDKVGVYGALVGAPLPEGLAPMPLPPKRLAAMQADLAAQLEATRRTAEALASYEKDLPALQAKFRRGGEVWEYVAVAENMTVEGPVAYITGFCDARKTADLQAEASRRGWGLALRDPEPGEDVPTLLEPPRIFRPVTSLFAALGIMPGYTETDVSVPFYIFFTLFFAMLIGDAGYGALILLLAVLAHRKTRAKFKGAIPQAVGSIFTLLYMFGGATIVWGVLSGTYFAIPQTAIPAILQFKSIPFLNDMNHIMQICFTIGAVHLSVARLWNAAALFPNKKFLAEIGWVGVVWSMYLIVCGIVVAGFSYPSWGVPAMIVSVLLIALFMLDVSELRENGVSLAMLPLNVISSMGDIISYVRLYAVSLASVKVAENFNAMSIAIDLQMYVKVPVMLFVLLFGHGLNFAMGGLSILVHAVRLNTLEFSGAKGVSWSGRPFKPFKSAVPQSAPATKPMS